MTTLNKIKNIELRNKVKEKKITIQEAHSIQALEEILYSTANHFSVEGLYSLRDMLDSF